MEWYRGPEGDQRVWYELDEIERIMSDEIRRSGQRLSLERPVPDLELFVENHLKADLDQYAALPEDVLGLTQFEPGKPPVMKLNATLTEAADTEAPESGKRGRWRATLAHEAAHVLLHRYLFDPAMAQVQRGDFRDPEPAAIQSGGLMRCLHRDIALPTQGSTRTSRDWREVQANRGMAALLMPTNIFRRTTIRAIGDLSLGVVREDSDDEVLLTQTMATKFDVSRQAAQLRLRGLSLVELIAR